MAQKYSTSLRLLLLAFEVLEVTLHYRFVSCGVSWYPEQFRFQSFFIVCLSLDKANHITGRRKQKGDAHLPENRRVSALPLPQKWQQKDLILWICSCHRIKIFYHNVNVLPCVTVTRLLSPQDNLNESRFFLFCGHAGCYIFFSVQHYPGHPNKLFILPCDTLAHCV